MQKVDGGEEIMSTPGIYVSGRGLGEILEKLKEKPFVLLSENGKNIRDTELNEDSVFVLGGQLDLTEDEEKLVLNMKPEMISLGPEHLLASHCITVTLNALENI